MAFVASDREDPRGDRVADDVQSSFADKCLSACLCIVLPIAFWMVALTLGLAALGLSMSNWLAALAIVAMAAILVPVWASVVGLTSRR